MNARGRKNWLGPAALGLCLAVMALAAAPALGYFSTTGSGTLTAGVASLGAPTISSAKAATGGTVTLAWSKATAPGAVAYYVTRNGGAAGGDCPTIAEPENEDFGCTDSGLEPGTYAYRVVAKYRSWTATSAAVEAKITIGAPDHFVLAVASTTPNAAAADNLTITAKDRAGTTVTSYTGSHSLTFEGAAPSPGGTAPTVSNSAGTAVAFGTATALTFSSGVATVSSSKNGVMKLYKAGPTTISVTDGAIESEVDPVVTVAPLAMSKLVLSAATATPTAGAEDALTVTATDTYGNTATGYTGSHSLVYSGASASANNNKPTVSDKSGNDVAFGTATPTSFTAGVAGVSGEANGQMVLYKAAAANIKVTEGSISSATVSITASPAGATALKLAAATATPTAGAADALTVTALDAYGNTATGYTGSHSLVYSGAAAGPAGDAPTVSDEAGTATAFGAATATAFTAGVAAVSGTANGAMVLYKAGEAAAIKVTEGSMSSAAVNVTAAAATAASLKLTAATATPVVATADNLTTTAYDAYGNTATGYTGSHSITFAGPEAGPSGTAATVSNSSGTAVNVGTATSLSFTAGVATVSSTKNGVFKAARSGAASLTATDGSISTAAALALTVSAGAAAKYAWVAPTISAGTLGSPCLFTCAITTLGNGGTFVAKVAVTDSLGNVVSNLGTANAVTVTATGGSITGGSLTIATTGLAESTTAVTYKSPTSGSFSNTITAAKASGTAYTSATATASK
ncbi:MAG TPA: fibronectin type III domain-containing protein [Solirubrobacterales bacterium]|nr:fibronectin type III domain-containing protein [Solirubrobacterales bacterium]